MAIINPDGLFGGDRLRHCSNLAQLHWPRLFLASDGFGRLELNYHKIVARAYATFSPVPSEQEVLGCIQEYLDNFLLFGYAIDGQAWGQWDTPVEFLPRYKTAADKRSPAPPEPAFLEWKRRYRSKSKTLPKCFENFPETFRRGVGGGGGDGDGKTMCASGEARGRDAGSVSLTGTDTARKPDQRIEWFSDFWNAYKPIRSRAKKDALKAFLQVVKTEAVFRVVMEAVKSQTPEMISRAPEHRPYAGSWLRGQRWLDEAAEAAQEKPDEAMALIIKMRQERTQ